MTGCYAQRISLGVGDRVGVLVPQAKHGLHPDEITIAASLQSQGYATAHIGKWHLGDQPQFLPTRFGFEYYFGIPYSNDMSPTYRLYKDKDIPPLPLMRGETVIEAEPDQSTITARYTDEAVDFIREHKEGPFYLYLAHNYVHVPLYPSDEWRRRSRNGDYGAEVSCIDWSTGRIIDTLKKQGIAENTLVIFSSDNGAGLGDGEPGNSFEEPLAELTRPGRNIRPCGYEKDPQPLAL